MTDHLKHAAPLGSGGGLRHRFSGGAAGKVLAWDDAEAEKVSFKTISEVGGGGAYRHVQGSPASVWTINHNLGFMPGGILVIDSGGSIVEGEIVYNDLNTLTISFYAAGAPSSFSGEAYIS